MDQMAVVAPKKSLMMRWKSLSAREARLAWLLILPTAIIVFGLVLFPAVYSIWISFHDVGLKNLGDVAHSQFVGWENYRKVLMITPSNSRDGKVGERRLLVSFTRLQPPY